MDEKMDKGPGSQMSAPAIRSEIDRKLHCLAGPAHSGVSAPVERPRDADAKAKGYGSGGQKQRTIRFGV